MTKKKEKRNKRIFLLVTATEKRLWKAAAEDSDRSLNSFVRKLINRYIKKTAT